MATTKKTIETTNDKKDKISIVEIIQDIDSRLTHIEDMYMDNRELIVKLVKQGNTVVEFLKDFQIEPIDAADLEMEMGIGLPSLPSYVPGSSSATNLFIPPISFILLKNTCNIFLPLVSIFIL